MSIQIVEIAQPSVIDTVAVAQPSTVEVVEVRQGPAGPAGPNAVNASTTSDGTANLSLAAATVSGTLTAPTAATTTSTTQVATTAFVQQEIASGVAVAKNLEFLAHNGSGVTITKGSIVYINGAVGGVPRVVKAQANNDTNSARTIGFVKQDILDGANGFVIIEGELQNVSTADSISIIGPGIQLYLSPTTPGAFTRTKPSAPSHMVYVGVVVTASTGVALDGKILVGIQNGYELNEIHDVSITAPVAAKQVIKRNAGNTLWANEAIVSADVSDATDAATPSTLVRRDATGGADFAGTVNLNIGVISDLRFEDYQAANGANFLYNGTSASDHRIALGAGTTGATLFGAADAGAARTTLELGGAVIRKITTADVSRNNTGTGTTYTNDATLQSFAVDANSWYLVEFALMFTCTVNSGIKTQLLHPALATASANCGRVHSASIPTDALSSSATVTTLLSVTAVRNISPISGYCRIRIGASGGNIALQWAQNVASADNTTLLAGSLMTVTKI